MSIPASALNPCDIQQQMDEHYRFGFTYGERDSQYERFVQAISRTEQQSLRRALVLRAHLCAYTGDGAGLREQLRQLDRIKHDEIDRLSFSAAFATLGLMPESRRLLLPLIKFSNGLLSQLIRPALAAGLICTILQEHEQAASNGMAYTDPHTTGGVTLSLMQSLGLSDDQIIPHVDALGEAARQHKKLLLGISVCGVSVPDVFEGLALHAEVAATAGELYEINFHLAAQSDATGLLSPPGFSAMIGRPTQLEALVAYGHEAKNAQHTS